MKNTSLQSIVANTSIHLEQMQIRKLFQRHKYPHFELQDLNSKPELIKRQLFTFFLNILEQWNKNVDNPNQQINECQYKRNQFIYSWLKWLAVQNTSYVDSSLIRLQKWYNTSRLKQPTIFLRRQDEIKSCAQEWEIRNSYRSNLPLEIENYKRRVFFNIRSVCNSPRKGRQKQNAIQKKQVIGMRILEEAKDNKKQNAFVRLFREDMQMKNYMDSFRKSKGQFYKNLTKNYYRGQFLKDKLLTASPHQIQEKNNNSSLIKNYRIKTSTQGFRHFSGGQSPTLGQTAVLPFYQTKNSSLIKSDLQQTTNTLSGSKFLNTSNIDGISLLVNPFDSKIKKKKRN